MSAVSEHLHNLYFTLFFFFFFFRKIELCFCIDGDVEMFFFLVRF